MQSPWRQQAALRKPKELDARIVESISDCATILDLDGRLLQINAAGLQNLGIADDAKGDDGQQTGGLAVDSNLGWKGPDKYVAAVPQVFDLLADPQERYDIFMNNFTERTWTLVTINESIKDLMKTYVEYPPSKLQSEIYTGPITLPQYQRFQHVRESLKKEGFTLPLPTGN